MALNLFTGGYLPLEQRCQAENLYWAILVKLKKLVAQMEDVPEDLQGLDDTMADTYFCNFSLFQSIPDSWAIKQLFPIMPIHRLNQAPSHHARARRHHLRLGRQDRFVHRPPRRQAHAAAAHGQRRAATTSGVFLVGAYQEILGDLHNLFGDTHAVHVSLDKAGNVVLDAVIKGDTVREVLDYVEFDAETLVRKLRHDVELAVREGRIELRGIRPSPGVLRRGAPRVHVSRGAPRPLNYRRPFLQPVLSEQALPHDERPVRPPAARHS